MKTKGMVLTLVTVLILSFVLSLAGCSSQAPASSPAQTSVAPAPSSKAPTTSAPASSAQGPITQSAAPGAKHLKASFDQPPSGVFILGWNWLTAEFAKQTNGRYVIDTYPSQTLVKSTETMNALADGVTDFADVPLMTFQSAYPISSVVALPSLSFPGTPAGDLAGRNAVRELTEKFPSVANEYKRFKVISYQVTPANFIMTKKSKVVVPNDLKGLKIASQGSDQDIISMAGGVPVNMPPPQVYEAMDKGVVEGSLIGWYHIISQHFEEVGGYYLDNTFSELPHRVMMNTNSWNSLPPDVQKIIVDLTPQYEARTSDIYVQQLKDGRQKALDKGRTITVPTPEQKKLWNELIQPMEGKWLDQAKAKGVTDAPAILDFMKQRSAEAWSKNQ